MGSPYSFLVFLGHGQTDKDDGEDGEDIGLDQRDQHLEERDEQDEREGGQGRGQAERRARVMRDPQEEAEEDQKDRVAPRHVGEQTHGQREGLRHEPDELDHEQERPQKPGRASRHEVDPVLAPTVLPHARDLDHDEYDRRQRAGNREVPGRRAVPRVHREGQQPPYVREEDEEEERPEEPQVAPAALRAEPGVDDLVPHPDQRNLQQRDHSGLPRLRRDPPGRPPEKADHERGDLEEEQLMGRQPERQPVVEQVLDDVLGRERHAALRVRSSVRSTRTTSTPRYAKKKTRNVRAKAVGSAAPVRRKRRIRTTTTKSRARNPPASVVMADFMPCRSACRVTSQPTNRFTRPSAAPMTVPRTPGGSSLMKPTDATTRRTTKAPTMTTAAAALRVISSCSDRQVRGPGG